MYTWLSMYRPTSSCKLLIFVAQFDPFRLTWLQTKFVPRMTYIIEMSHIRKSNKLTIHPTTVLFIYENTDRCRGNQLLKLSSEAVKHVP